MKQRDADHDMMRDAPWKKEWNILTQIIQE